MTSISRSACLFPPVAPSYSNHRESGTLSGADSSSASNHHSVINTIATEKIQESKEQSSGKLPKQIGISSEATLRFLLAKAKASKAIPQVPIKDKTPLVQGKINFVHHTQRPPLHCVGLGEYEVVDHTSPATLMTLNVKTCIAIGAVGFQSDTVLNFQPDEMINRGLLHFDGEHNLIHYFLKEMQLKGAKQIGLFIVGSYGIGSSIYREMQKQLNQTGIKFFIFDSSFNVFKVDLNAISPTQPVETVLEMERCIDLMKFSLTARMTPAGHFLVTKESVLDQFDSSQMKTLRFFCTHNEKGLAELANTCKHSRQFKEEVNQLLIKTLGYIHHTYPQIRKCVLSSIKFYVKRL